MAGLSKSRLLLPSERKNVYFLKADKVIVIH